MIKAVIFDVGGVLLRTENDDGRRRWEARLGLPAGGAEYYVFNSGMGRRAQLGQITTAALWEWIGDQFQLSPADRQQFHADFWAGDKLDSGLVQLIRRLQPAHKLGIISNYADCLRHELVRDMQIADLFDQIIISAEVGVMKPAPEIYRLALAALDVAPAQALFIDDFAHNIAGAAAVGMPGIHFSTKIDLAAALQERGVTLAAEE